MFCSEFYEFEMLGFRFKGIFFNKQNISKCAADLIQTK